MKNETSLEIIDKQVNHPSHYTFGGIEAIDYLMDRFPFCPLLWQTGKYVFRLGKKDEYLQDVSKAFFYFKAYQDSPYSKKPLPDYRKLSFKGVILPALSPYFDTFQITVFTLFENLFDSSTEETLKALRELFESHIEAVKKNSSLKGSEN